MFLRTCLHSSDLKPEERRQATPETKASAPTETTTERCALSKNPHELARCSPMSREEEDELSELTPHGKPPNRPRPRMESRSDKRSPETRSMLKEFTSLHAPKDMK